ncbi:cation:proton antiporter [Dyella solisilvae]|uniref:Cation:proton antiporter n=1 Tax=Dyella solisilvae TaxID=1920168 RepID=A0A370K3G3_9GAMM|nr:cation:proton antiporter [Dyella solisilvae]RDI97205.1 cation:proton antiporter [Dyella solisilvae]
MGHPLLLVQLLVIIVAARLMAWALRWLGQPAVVGEMIAGLALGPLVFGALAPSWQAQLFPADSLGNLQSLSTLGLVLFMTVVGAELRIPQGSRVLRPAGWIGGLACALPALLALGIAPWLYGAYAPAGVAYWPFALFLATACAITALPVMARIVKERRLTDTTPGRLGLAAAAVADVFAWVALAFVVALISARGSWWPFLRTIGGLLGLLAVAWLVLRPLCARLLARHAPDGQTRGAVLAFLLAGAFGCAAVTEWLGLHAVFGAFLFGVCLPRDDRLLHGLIERVEHVTLAAFLPVVFVLAGLSTTAELLSADAALALTLVLLVAIGGKLIGGALGARVAGQGWRDSLAIGSLMNARGLMELIVIKVGLDAGVITPAMFTILLVMAILTTMMTTPMVMALESRGAAAVSEASGMSGTDA